MLSEHMAEKAAAKPERLRAYAWQVVCFMVGFVGSGAIIHLLVE